MLSDIGFVSVCLSVSVVCYKAESRFCVFLLCVCAQEGPNVSFRGIRRPAVFSRFFRYCRDYPPQGYYEEEDFNPRAAAGREYRPSAFVCAFREGFPLDTDTGSREQTLMILIRTLGMIVEARRMRSAGTWPKPNWLPSFFPTVLYPSAGCTSINQDRTQDLNMMKILARCGDRRALEWQAPAIWAGRGW